MSRGGDLGFPRLKAIWDIGNSRLREAKARTDGMEADIYHVGAFGIPPDVGRVIVIYTFYAF